MLTSRDEIVELALELAWSHWAELGVGGWVRRHAWQAIDLEPLIVFTAFLGERDARLRDESLDWSVANARFISAVRLRNLSRSFAHGAEGADRYAAAVRTHAGVQWPGEGEPLPFQRTNRSTRPDLSRPALIQLRLRAFTGVSARAEVLRLLLAEPARPQSASELAADTGYGKGNVAATLGALVMSGIVEGQRAGNQLKHRLARPQELVAVLGGIPPVFPRWPSIFRVITVLLSGRGAGAPPIARAADIRGLLRSVDDDLRRLGLADDLPKATGEALTVDFAEWASHLLRGWAAVDERSSGNADTEYTVHRLSTGDWLSTVAVTGEAPRPINLTDRDERHGESSWADAVIADDPDGAPQLARAMLGDAERRAASDSGTFRAGEPVDGEVSRAFADERLWSMRPGHAATFSGDFLRRWVADRRQRLGEEPGGRSARAPRCDPPSED